MAGRICHSPEINLFAQAFDAPFRTPTCRGSDSSNHPEIRFQLVFKIDDTDRVLRFQPVAQNNGGPVPVNNYGVRFFLKVPEHRVDAEYSDGD
jgi:hypothetical protein